MNKSSKIVIAMLMSSNVADAAKCPFGYGATSLDVTDYLKTEREGESQAHPIV